MAKRSPEDDIITINGVNKTFPGGERALRDISLRIARSEVVVVIGPSGSGKSTLLRCINGLEEIDSGRVIVDGILLDDDKKHRAEIRREVGMVFQSFNLFPHMSVFENVTLAQRLVRKRAETRPLKQRWTFSVRSASMKRRTNIPVN